MQGGAGVGSGVVAPAQTNVALLQQCAALGWSSDDLRALGRSYDFALRLFAARFRGGGRPFVCHLVGTASIAASAGASRECVLGGLLHAAYQQGDFGTLRWRLSAHHRNAVRQVAGDAVEQIVFLYETATWDPRRPTDELSATDPLRRDVLLLRVANAIDDALEAFAGSKGIEYHARELRLAVGVAERHGWKSLAEQASSMMAALEATEPLPVDGVRNSSFTLLPASATERWVIRWGRRAKKLLQI